MSFRDIHTAPIDRSIWADLPEDNFRHHLVALEERTNAVPIDAQAFDPDRWIPGTHRSPRGDYTLPLAVEQQLADDFACLVAVEEGAQSVAAVCVEELAQPPALILRFAALDISMNDTVKGALQTFSTILADSTSENGRSAKQFMSYVDDLFHTVLSLHHRRLLARLRSVKWEKPRHLAKSHKKPLWQDFTNLLHRTQFCYVKKEKPSRQGVEKSLMELQSLFKAFELIPSHSTAEINALKQLVIASFACCKSDIFKDYVCRLESSVGATPTKQVGSAIKCIRQIQKIAAYRRICVSMVETARCYSQLFQHGLKFTYLTPYKSVPTTIGYEEWAKTCHVHAEVQLAVHYDIITQSSPQEHCSLRPRAIGISKWLCYLCYQFLRAHKQFFPSKTHGRLYDQWTIPDLAEFSEDTCEKYREIIAAIDKEVLHQAQSEPELWRIEPMTSADYQFVTRKD